MFFRAYNLTSTPPKSKLYTTPKNSVQNSKSKIGRKKNPKCPDSQCNSNYIGQTKCRLLKRVIEHNKQNKNSNLLIHSNDKSHHRVWLDDFEIIGKGFKRQISEACLLYTSPSPRDATLSRMPSSA